MSDIFIWKNNSNLFDNLVVDVNKIYEQYPEDRKIDPLTSKVKSTKGPFHKIYSAPVIPLKYRNYLWHFFRRINLDQTWFEEFKHYWSNVLGGRPLWSTHDFFFLRNLYRLKQETHVPDTNDSNIHLEAWQRPDLIYQLVHQVYKESFSNAVRIISLLKKTKKQFHSILEFGCATAPITTSLLEFSHSFKKYNIFISDIKTISFHYGAYKFRNYSNVIPILLTPDNDFLLTQDLKVDVICCCQVFEHLNKPMETMERFYNILNSGGFMCFDYIKSDGKGLDTQQGLRERERVIDFINKFFDIVHGDVDKDGSLGLTIVRKH